LLLDELENEEARSYRLNYLADFNQRWGTLSLDRLLTIARDFAPERPRSEVDLEDQDDLAYYGPRTSEEADVHFVLAALSMLGAPETPEVLLPYLASQHAIERWLASLGLVMMRDERVLPALEQLLVEFAGPNQPWTPKNGSLDTFRLWRHQLLRMLANWGDPRIIPSVREGLIATVHAEEVEVPEPHGSQQEFIWRGERFTGAEAWQWFHSERMAWVDEEHLFVYALGQLSAFGALVGGLPGVTKGRASTVLLGKYQRTMPTNSELMSGEYICASARSNPSFGTNWEPSFPSPRPPNSVRQSSGC
jgi:hypothetical protein